MNAENATATLEIDYVRLMLLRLTLEVTVSIRRICRHYQMGYPLT